MDKVAYPCHADPDLFFSDVATHIDIAKRMCEDCPVSRFVSCRHEGWNHEHGVFGGMSAPDRRMADPERVAALTRRGARNAAQVDTLLTRDKVVNMRREGLPIAEVAARVGKTANAVKLIVHRARKAGLTVDAGA